jgi:hypothetical protein
MGDLSSWLQAFAAVVALGISVWAVRSTNTAQKRRDDAEAYGLAVALQPELMHFRAPMENAVLYLERIKETHADLVGQSVAGEIGVRASLPEPVLLNCHVERLFVLSSPTGPRCIYFHSLLLQYPSALQDYVQQILVMPGRTWVPVLEVFLTQLRAMAASRNQCEHDLNAIIKQGALGGNIKP